MLTDVDCGTGWEENWNNWHHSRTGARFLILELSWAVLGGCLGLSWGCLGAVLGLSWVLLGLSWALLGCLGLSWGCVGFSWASLGFSWGSLGLSWGLSWAVLGLSWGCLGLSWGFLGFSSRAAAIIAGWWLRYCVVVEGNLARPRTSFVALGATPLKSLLSVGERLYH